MGGGWLGGAAGEMKNKAKLSLGLSWGLAKLGNNNKLGQAQVKLEVKVGV